MDTLTNIKYSLRYIIDEEVSIQNFCENESTDSSKNEKFFNITPS